MKNSKKMLLLILNLLIVLILPLHWYSMTKADPMTYQLLGHTGFAAFREFGYAFALIYLACMLYYGYSLIKNIYINLYVCDIVLILIFTLFPSFRGWPLGTFGIEQTIQFYGVGYFAAMGILFMNLVGVIFYHRFMIKLSRVEEKKEV